MKKIVIVCAVLLAGILSSCGDTNYCYEVTTKVNSVIEISTTTYHWCTSNELEAIKADLKAAQTNMGISEDKITITAVRTNRSEADCHK
jgi:hypothetical protein